MNMIAVVGGKAGWDPSFAKLMGPGTKRQKLDQSQPVALPLNGESTPVELSLCPANSLVERP